MANSAQAKKRARQAENRRTHNAGQRTELRSAIKNVKKAIAAGDKTAALAALKSAEPEIMRAAQKGVIHRNAANRKVSRLAHGVARLGK